ncbi:amidohydrolase family protein [Vibrio sp.]|nr:amidohydrolase family protein [Vibrio sp.]
MNYLIKGALVPQGTRFSTLDIRIEDNIIADMGTDLVCQPGEKVIDAKGCVAYPGFVNTHHHLAQSILKGIPAGQNHALGDWLSSVPYRFWPHITPDIMYHAASLGFWELLRSGTTTCADHHYLYHAATTPELEESVWQAAEDMGIRFVLCRGGATVLGSHKGFLKAGVTPESIDLMLRRLDESVSRHHESGSCAMKKVVVAPTTLVHSSTPNDLRLLAEFARSHKLKMHSHMLEVGFDQKQSLNKYGMGAIEFAESCNWLGKDVWFAHLVQADSKDIATLAETKTGIAHCPTSNCRLGSGIANIIEMEKKGMPVSIGVDGSASSESGSMLQELNLSWLIHRAINGANATSIDKVLSWGTEGGAKILGLEGVGAINIGYAADLVLYDLQSARLVGCHDQAYAPLLCGEPATVKMTWVNGKCVYSKEMSLGMEEKLIENAYKALHSLLDTVRDFER